MRARVRYSSPLLISIQSWRVRAMQGEGKSVEELLEEANREVRRMAWLAVRERRPSRVIMALGVPGRERAPVFPPTPYPRWGVRPEEQLVRFNHRIDPMQRIPPAPIQDVTAVAMLARLHRDPEVVAEDQLQILAEVSETWVLQEKGKWRWNLHGNGR
jgi:hypothetical protein